MAQSRRGASPKCSASWPWPTRFARKPGAATAALKAAGIRHTVMLTGDNERTARAIAEQAGVDDVRANLLPDGKVQAIEKLMDEYGRVAMVGDGVNDAPALARSTVGIAMGGAGTDQALETADIVLMGDDLLKLPFVIRLSRQTLAVLRQNIAFSLLVKAVVMVLVLTGHGDAVDGGVRRRWHVPNCHRERYASAARKGLRFARDAGRSRPGLRPLQRR